MNSFYRIDPALATKRRRYSGQAFYFERTAVCRVLISRCYLHLVVDSTTSITWTVFDMALPWKSRVNNIFYCYRGLT